MSDRAFGSNWAKKSGLLFFLAYRYLSYDMLVSISCLFFGRKVL
jgi:hypothetical protein